MDKDNLNDELERAALALRVAGEQMDAALEGLKDTISAMQLASHAQLEAMDAVINAIRETRS